MSVDVGLLKDTVKLPPLPFEDPKQIPFPLEGGDPQQVYHFLETLAQAIDQLTSDVADFRQRYYRLSQIDKEPLLQTLVEAAPEDVVDLHRVVREAVRSIPQALSWRQILKQICSIAQTDSGFAKLLPPEKRVLLEESIDTLHALDELTLRHLSWIEEYMDDVIKQAQLPSWVGSISLEADCSDHHLG